MIKNSLKDYFNHVSVTIGTADTLENALNMMNHHWSKKTDALQKEIGIFDNEPLPVRLKAKFHAAVDTMQHDIPRRLATILAVGSFMGLVNHKYTIPAALLGAAIHTGLDMIVEGAYDASYEGRKRAKESKRKPTIDHYAFGENATYLFRKQDYTEISKHEALIDTGRYQASDFTFPNYGEMNLDNNTMHTADYRHAETIEEHILYMHQRGVASQCHLYDDNTIINYFENGIVRVMQLDPETQRYSVYAQHHPELCSDPDKALSQTYIDQIKNNIIAYTYEKHNQNFADGLSTPAEIIDQKH